MVIDYGKIIFGGVDSSDYGIYISGEGVYNAPERAVELVNVPGRNGAIALDQGRYNNIIVTYPAMVLEEDQETFRERLSAFRNAILSQRGYQRLEDSYHPEEYRMGVYCEGLEVKDLLTYHQGGNFELTFNCKPQRWLTVGEYPIPVESGDILQNMTPFDAGPLLNVEGYGTISFNGYDVVLNNEVMGNVILADAFGQAGVYDSSTMSFSATKIFPINPALCNIGDDITIDSSQFSTEFYSRNERIGSTSIGIDGDTDVAVADFPKMSDYDYQIRISFEPLSFVCGTPKTYYLEYTVCFNKYGDPYTAVGEITSTAVIEHTLSDGIPQITFQFVAQATSGLYPPENANIVGGKVSADSSVSILGHPTFIDCELGEAYMIKDGGIISLNRYLAFGSDLPVLAPGSNRITFSNTITDLKIAPRWWRI